jgi:hypothetical protein
MGVSKPISENVNAQQVSLVDGNHEQVRNLFKLMILIKAN